MQRVLVFAALFVSAFAADSLVAYAGTTVGSATIVLPTFTTNPAACTLSASHAPYVQFQLNVTVAGVQSIQIMAEKNFKSYVNALIYTTAVNPADSCAGLYLKRSLEKKSSLSGGPVVDDIVYFAVGSYNVVVTGTGDASEGIFAIHVNPAHGVGSITVASPTYSYPSVSSGVCSAAANGTVPFAAWSWNATATKQYDIVAGISNETNSWSYSCISVYMGTVAAGTISADPCTASWITTYCASSMLTGVFNMTLTAGQVYTFVVSGEYDYDNGYFGVFFAPSSIESFVTSSSYTQPSRGLTPPDCSASTNLASWWALTFTATGAVYVIDTSETPSVYVDTYSFFYSGNNYGNAVVAPATCPIGQALIVAGDTGDITPVYGFTTIGQNYTVVVSTYSGSITAGDFILYTFSGIPIGTIPVTTTGPVSTGGVTSVSGSTGVSTAAVSSGGVSTGNSTATTSSASTISASFFVLALLAFLL